MTSAAEEEEEKVCDAERKCGIDLTSRFNQYRVTERTEAKALVAGRRAIKGMEEWVGSGLGGEY